MTSTCMSREITLTPTTCLKWTSNGELCAEDRLGLLNRLMQIDSRLADCFRE